VLVVLVPGLGETVEYDGRLMEIGDICSEKPIAKGADAGGAVARNAFG